MRLKGRVAIITGGGTGIGQAIAIAFAQEGASVAICGRREQPLVETVRRITSNNGSAIYESVDITNHKQVKNFVGNVNEIYGSVDILVNNAGIAAAGNVLETTEYEWDNVLSVDLKAIMIMSKTVIPYMLKKQQGKIINISSIAGLIGFGNSAAYCAAKGAVINLTRQIALDFAKSTITVNCIAPGFIETDMTSEYLASEEYKRYVVGNTPLGRIGTPEDIAMVSTFLASPESNFMTGQTLVVDGGWTIK